MARLAYVPFAGYRKLSTAGTGLKTKIASHGGSIGRSPRGSGILLHKLSWVARECHPFHTPFLPVAPLCCAKYLLQSLK